jgi:hypothetical protein
MSLPTPWTNAERKTVIVTVAKPRASRLAREGGACASLAHPLRIYTMLTDSSLRASHTHLSPELGGQRVIQRQVELTQDRQKLRRVVRCVGAGAAAAFRSPSPLKSHAGRATSRTTRDDAAGARGTKGFY